MKGTHYGLVVHGRRDSCGRISSSRARYAGGEHHLVRGPPGKGRAVEALYGKELSWEKLPDRVGVPHRGLRRGRGHQRREPRSLHRLDDRLAGEAPPGDRRRCWVGGRRVTMTMATRVSSGAKAAARATTPPLSADPWRDNQPYEFFNFQTASGANTSDQPHRPQQRRHQIVRERVPQQRMRRRTARQPPGRVDHLGQRLVVGEALHPTRHRRHRHVRRRDERQREDEERKPLRRLRAPRHQAHGDEEPDEGEPEQRSSSPNAASPCSAVPPRRNPPRSRSPS